MARPTKLFSLNKRGYWTGFFHRENQRPIERTLISDKDLKAQARTKSQRDSLLLELHAQKNPANLSAQSSAQSSAIDRDKANFLAYVAAERSPATFKEYAHTLNQLESFEEIDLLKKRWAALGQSPNTINKKIRTIRSFENWRVEKENNLRAAKSLPLTHARKFRNLRVDPANIASYTKEEADQILALIEDRIANPPSHINPDLIRRWELLRRAWFLARYAGLRGAEILALRWEDIELNPIDQDSFIDINSHENARGRWFQVKQHHAAKIEIIHTRLIHELQSWDRNHEFVCGNHWNSSVELGRAFTRLQEELGISDEIKPVHGFRALFATELHNLGASLKDVKDQLRHSSISTTERYIDKRNNSRGSRLRALTAAA